MQEAQNAIDSLVESEIREGDLLTLDFDRVVEHVMQETGVSRNMAEMYVRDSTEIQKSGKKRLVLGMEGEDVDDRMGEVGTEQGAATKAAAAADTNVGSQSDPAEHEAVETEDDVLVSDLNMSVGDRTGEYFGTDDEGKGGLGVLEPTSHPLVPDVDQTYLKRPQQGDTTDIENITAFMEDPDFATLLVGETGTGKDFAIKYICARTNRPVIRVNFGIGIRYEDLVGGFQPRTEEAAEKFDEVRRFAQSRDVSMEQAIEIHGMSSQFEFVPGVLYQAVKNGWTFVADEINAAGAEATMPLHGVTEDRDSRELVVRQTGEVLEPHDEFRFVGTMNPPTYAGTKPLNDAFRTRFWPVRMDYLPPEGERELIMEAAKVYDRDAGEEVEVFDSDDEQDVANVERLTELLAQLRDAYKSGDNITPISHREAIKIGKLSDRMGMKGAAKYVLGNISQPEDKSAIQKTVETTKFH